MADGGDTLRLVQKIKADGTPVDAVNLRAMLSSPVPVSAVIAGLEAFARTVGVNVEIPDLSMTGPCLGPEDTVILSEARSSYVRSQPATTEVRMGVPSWPELWEREPALNGLDFAKAGESVFCPREGDCYKTDEPTYHFHNGELPAEFGDALARDAAVPWLGKRGVLLIFAKGDGEGASVYLDPHPGAVECWQRKGPFSGTTLDEALRAACAAVINQRTRCSTAPKPTP